MNFIALYRGPTVSEAQLVAVCSESDTVGRFLRELIGESDEPKNHDEASECDPTQVICHDKD